MRLSFVNLFNFAHKVLYGAVLKLAQTQPCVAGLQHLGFHRHGFNFFANDGHGERAALVFAEDGQHHFGVGLTSHALDGLVQRQTLDRGVVHLGDQVVGFQASPVSWGAFNGGHHLHQTIFLSDFNAHAHKSAGGAFSEFFVRLFVEVLGMRVQAGNHARDSVSDELFLVHRLYIVGLDHAEHCGELLQLFKR